MRNFVKITPNEQNRALIHLYGRDIDVTDKADASGKGSIKAYGDTYDFQIEQPSKTVQKKLKIAKETKAAKPAQPEGVANEV